MEIATAAPEAAAANSTARADVRTRLVSIDLLRGLVIVIMALDHVRDLLTPPFSAVLDFGEADTALFFTRWVTHLCAPTFILLAGTSAFLYGSRVRSTRELSRFLITRGLWLVLVELTVVGFSLNFNVGPGYTIFLQVIWAIGWSMVALAALIWLPRYAIAAVAIAMIAGRNLLDAVQPDAANASVAWLLLHIQGRLPIDGAAQVLLVYPLVPWIGVMALGYVIGPWFTVADPNRPKRLMALGSALIVCFLLLRMFQLHGEPDAWQTQETLTATLIDFLDLTKYPPSLQFLLMTLGPAFLLLGAFENSRGPLSRALIVLGRVPFFFYVVHFYLIHALALALGVGLGLLQGFSVGETAVIFLAYPQDFGLSLGGVYVVWLAIIVILYPACRWFSELKARRRHWWLSYL